MDIDEYIDYNIAEIYSANADWPGIKHEALAREKADSQMALDDLSILISRSAGITASQYNSNTLGAGNGNERAQLAKSTLVDLAAQETAGESRHSGMNSSSGSPCTSIRPLNAHTYSR